MDGIKSRAGIREYQRQDVVDQRSSLSPQRTCSEERSGGGINSSQNEKRPSATPKPNKDLNKSDSSESSKCDADTGAFGIWCWGIVFVAAACLLCCLVGIIVQFFLVQLPDNEKSCSYNDLRKRYQEQPPNVWDSLTSGIENVINKRSETPAVYLLTHQDGANISQLVQDIAKRASNCVDSSQKPAMMPSSDFRTLDATNDYGHVIHKYKQKIQASRVVLIENLDEIPAEAARALHSICDTYSPIASDVVIFLTLKVPKSNGKPMANAEQKLRSQWSELKDNELDALITRVTDQVIPLHS